MLGPENVKPSGLSAQSLRTWGILALIAGMVNRTVIQGSMMGMQGMNTQQLLQAMQDPAYMGIATISLVLSAVEICAAPIFAFLLVEGAWKTASIGNYILRVAGAAVICEIPYDLMCSGKAFYWGEQNPLIGLCVCLLVLFFYKRYSEKSLKSIALKVVLTLAAVIWMRILRIADGACLVILVAAIWTFRKKKLVRTFAGCTAAALCTVFSPFYLAAPVSFLAIHFYSGEKGESSRLVNYLVYPALLVVFALVRILIIK